MSMFRKPGDSSSSSDSDTESRDVTSASDANPLSKINTLESASSAAMGEHSGRATRPTRPLVSRTNTGNHLRDILLHSLLEEKALNEAAEHLGKDRSDPNVQALAQQTYQDLARQISNQDDEPYASDEMRHHRAAAREGVNKATRDHMTGLTAAANATATTAATGASQALVHRPLGVQPDGAPAISSSLETFLSVPDLLPLSLRGYPGLHTNRYAREYDEIEMVGKGGYGKVYKVKHKLDNAFYAIKRIIVSAARVRKIQEGGPQEIESVLEEVRSLAQFDHGNIVRYHNAWLEFSTGLTNSSSLSKIDRFRVDRFLEDATGTPFTSEDLNLHTSFRDLSVSAPYPTANDNIMFEASDAAASNIIFEYSETRPEAEESIPEEAQASSTRRFSKRNNRRGSQATIATISSTKSRVGATESIEEDEEDIETIPRTYPPVFEESDSIVTDSEIPAHMIPVRSDGPTLTLNVQMSLYDTNLAEFLSHDHNSLNHCFHPCISLELLGKILKGVQYLHARGVVHRDLKPANIFLSLSSDRVPPSGSVDLCSCRSCPKRISLHITPRIGDFGLVAALGDGCLVAEGTKPVGTEFYRPPSGGKINEKLDVFALGIITLEMLQRFETRMERVEALTRLRRGEFPAGFAASIGDFGVATQEMLAGMVEAEDEQRWSCGEVKKEIEKMVDGMRV